MKTKNIIIVAILAILAYFAFFKKKSESAQSGNPPNDPLPEAEPVSTENVKPEPVSIDSGDGAAMIANRIRVLQKSNTAQELARSVSGDLYKGTVYPQGMKAAFLGLFGDSYAIPLFPSQIDPSFQSFVEGIQSVEDFNKMESSVGLEKALQNYKSALQYGEVSYFPPNLKELVDAENFGKPSKADKNKSERYGAWAIDTKTVFSNLARISKNYSNAMQNKAISDLRAAGWKFYGIDA